MRHSMPFVLVTALLMLASASVWGHCEIPCGIYDDQMRINMLKEHITTIEKSMDQIRALSAEDDKNYNQLVRWVTNKEDHANQFSEIVTQYFLTQRIKPAGPDDPTKLEKYQESLRLLHGMIVGAMKCKQTVDKAHTARLRELVDQFAELYFGGK